MSDDRFDWRHLEPEDIIAPNQIEIAVISIRMAISSSAGVLTNLNKTTSGWSWGKLTSVD